MSMTGKGIGEVDSGSCESGALDITELHLKTAGGSTVEVNKARMYWYGTNVWWTGEFVTQPSMVNAGEVSAEENLSNGIVPSGKEVEFKVDHGDFSIEWKEGDEQGPDFHYH